MSRRKYPEKGLLLCGQRCFLGLLFCLVCAFCPTFLFAQDRLPLPTLYGLGIQEQQGYQKKFQAKGKQGLFLFLQKGEENRPALRSFFQALDVLSPRFEVESFVLDAQGKPSLSQQAWAQALGLLGTPSCYLLDEALRPYARFFIEDKPLSKELWRLKWTEAGQLKEKRDALFLLAQEKGEKSSEGLQALYGALLCVPEESLPSAYTKQVRLLVESEFVFEQKEAWKSALEELESSEAFLSLSRDWGLPYHLSEKRVGELLARVEAYEKREDLTPFLRQYLLVEYKFPLLVQLAAYAQGEKKAFSATADRRMREALEALREGERLVPKSRLGLKAKELREKINTQRRLLR